MFFEVSKTVYLFICGTIHNHLQLNSWYNYSYSAEYSQSLFGAALLLTTQHNKRCLRCIQKMTGSQCTVPRETKQKITVIQKNEHKNPQNSSKA